MKRFPFQWVASGKQGGATLGMGGDHAARTGRTGAALPATRSVDAPLSRTGKCPAAGSGRYRAARNEKCYAAGSGAPVGHILERSSATAIASSTGLPGCCIAKSAVLIGLSDCQVCRTAVCCIDRSVGLPDLPVAKSAVLPGPPEARNSRFSAAMVTM